MSVFYAYLARMRNIRRWGLMRNTQPENIQEHSLQCAQIAHALAVLRNVRHGGQIDPAKAAQLALYHDAPEVITGDLPTPVKYFNADISDVYKEIEAAAAKSLHAMLPDDLRHAYEHLLLRPEEEAEWPIVKAADRLCAYIKCIEEERMGNREFELAKESILRDIEKSPLPEVKDFMDDFLPAFLSTLDELNNPR